MQEYRHGSLYVVESGREKHEIDKALQQIDDRLFVEKQVSAADQKPVWCVVCAVGGDVPPLTLIEWRDDDDNPLELSSGIVARMARMERDGARLADKVVKQNAAKTAALRATYRQHWADIGDDFQKRMSPGYSAVLHRGQHLRRSRDKRRARGENV